jgi:hypothetical protein
MFALCLTTPPSVLPDISPTRGESGRGHDPGPTCNVEIGASDRRGSLSPLVGEMSGRTEGDSHTRHIGGVLA